LADGVLADTLVADDLDRPEAGLRAGLGNELDGDFVLRARYLVRRDPGVREPVLPELVQGELLRREHLLAIPRGADPDPGVVAESVEPSERDGVEAAEDDVGYP
jgi:hypothetical protein